MNEATNLQVSSVMYPWLDALDRRPGVRPQIMMLGETMIFVLPIAADTVGRIGVQLVLRCYGNDDVSAAIEPDVRPRPDPRKL
jgi:hypothetical protein